MDHQLEGPVAGVADAAVLRAADGVRIEAAYLPGPGPGAPVIVVAHGFTGALERPAVRRAAAVFARDAAVVTFSFRGHGGSNGLSTVGDREALDVHAVVTHARKRGYLRVVTVGASMGAISVLREAARFRDVDGVVSISAPGRWAAQGASARLAALLVSTRGGRALARRAFRTYVFPEWTWSPPPVEMIEALTAPVLIVHGTEDRFIPRAQAQLLLGEPARRDGLAAHAGPATASEPRPPAARQALRRPSRAPRPSRSRRA